MFQLLLFPKCGLAITSTRTLIKAPYRISLVSFKPTHANALICHKYFRIVNQEFCLSLALLREGDAWTMKPN